nr:LegC family aminotransferase [uncultured Dyadobacter sp.]
MGTSDAEDNGYIPLCEPNLPGNEKQYIADAIDSNWLSGGKYLNLFEKQLAEFTGAAHAVGISSGTTALQIALLLADVGPGDLVIVPDLTFVATANAVKHTGADPILMDIDPDTWVMDLALLRDFLRGSCHSSGGRCYLKQNNRQIKALVTVHLLGNMCDMQELMQIGEEYGIRIIEDAACSLGSFQSGRHSGTFGFAGTLSFNSNKIITTGGGGAILTSNEAAARKARHLITQAKSHPVEYLHDLVGYNYRLVNPLAAIGAAQMELLDGFIDAKKNIAAYYRAHLPEIGTGFQKITDHTTSNCWHPALLVPGSRELVAFLAERKIESRPLWKPVHELPAYQNHHFITRHNNTVKISEAGIMLPCSTSITSRQLKRVCETIALFLTQ